MKRTYIYALAVSALLYTSCTKLDEKLHGQIGNEGITSGNVPALLNASYTAMRTPYQGPWGWWSLQEFTTDEAIVPTRAGDWDDNGAWRALHLHRWAPDHVRISDTFRDINSVSYVATSILQFNPTAGQAAQARFLRAYAQFSILDGWGQVPYREPGEAVTSAPKVRKAAEEIDYLIAELKAIIPDLPDGPNYAATKDAGRVLLMKCYLNKGAFLNRTAPVFDPADMAQVIALADEIINSGKYALTPKYFDNFAPANNVLSTENIFTAQNIGGSDAGGVKDIWVPGLHYNQNPSGYNGFCTLSDFYGKFEAADQRIGGPYAGVTNVSGLKVGFLVGQQYDQNGNELHDRRGNKLIFTQEVSIIERNENHLEVAGIRVVKYPVDYANTATNLAENDWVYYRYADVLLMKAEAQLRTGMGGAALGIVNTLRAARGASAFASLNEENLLDERGREFFWEGVRRQDLMRFGKFLLPWQEKPSDDARYLLFPIPDNQLGNPNYIQNTGY